MSRILARVASVLLIVAAVFVATRGLVRTLPGDPVESLIAESGTTIPAARLRAELGLDRPFAAAMIEDARKALHGDLGISLLSKQPVGPLLARRFVNTAHLALVALALGLAIAIPLGIAAAARAGSVADRVCSFHGALMAALPTPWTGPLLIILLAVWVPLFAIDESVALPALTLALSFSGLWARLIRERVRETLKYGAAPGARARGIPEWRVLLKYGLAPSAGALLAYLGTQLGWLLAGAVVTEVIFNWPGMGNLLVESVLRRDYPLVEAATFVTASCCVLGTLLGDLLQFAFDPRRAAE